MTPSLGPLEAQVMSVIWGRGESTVRDVAGTLESVTDSAYTTVMTVMSRLAEKRLLARKLRGRAFVYAPTLTRDEYDQTVSRQRVRTLIEEFGEVAIAQFAEELRSVDPERARRLGRMLRQDGSR